MFRDGYQGPRNYGAIYDNFISQIQQYNTERRLADRKAHPEKYRGDLHNYINRQRSNQGLGRLGDTGDLNVFAYPVMGAMAQPLASGLAGTGVISTIGSATSKAVPWMAKNIAIPYLGGRVVDEGMKMYNGKTWAENVRDGLVGLGMDNDWANAVGEISNPGWWIPSGKITNIVASIPLREKTSSVVNTIINWRPRIPSDASRYYRIVSDAGDPIGDAIETGAIRGLGLNPKAKAALMEASGKEISIVPKSHQYPMFTKGKPHEARISGGKKPIIIRSKKDTGPIVWEKTNVDFRHKGHAGIFRPNWFGDLNAAPT